MAARKKERYTELTSKALVKQREKNPAAVILGTWAWRSRMQRKHYENRQHKGQGTEHGKSEGQGQGEAPRDEATESGKH